MSPSTFFMNQPTTAVEAFGGREDSLKFRRGFGSRTRAVSSRTIRGISSVERMHLNLLVFAARPGYITGLAPAKQVWNLQEDL
jgi:hypothetical protein